MDFSELKILTFDCYGTLIDWETGILNAIKPFLEVRGVEESDEAILRLYGKFEPGEEHGAYKPYREVLRGVMRRFGTHFDLKINEQDLHCLEDSLPGWPPFPDTVEALRRLANRYKLVVISNIDRDLIEGTARQLGNPFAEIITAQDVRSYKPDLRNFLFAREKLGLNPRNHLHVAQSMFHDIAPACRLGMRTIWVDRRKGKPGGATPPSEARPDLRFESLAEMADFLLTDH